mmetsp:Transcript_74675/g.194444  ORF Transcript_74675/g.194444 Transcript_74675/m.194444 type:complete len:200 (+) Transcript_74675:768-1367(+)
MDDDGEHDADADDHALGILRLCTGELLQVALAEGAEHATGDGPAADGLDPGRLAARELGAQDHHHLGDDGRGADFEELLGPPLRSALLGVNLEGSQARSHEEDAHHRRQSNRGGAHLEALLPIQHCHAQGIWPVDFLDAAGQARLSQQLGHGLQHGVHEVNNEEQLGQADGALHGDAHGRGILRRHGRGVVPEVHRLHI